MNGSFNEMFIIIWKIMGDGEQRCAKRSYWLESKIFCAFLPQ